MGQVEEIKQKLDIVEVIREYVPVKATGANFQALCPFHNEKTPSFVISPDKQIWHCFGCGRGGDVLAFVMEKEGLSFPEALRFLAPKAGVVLRQENQKEYSRRNRLLDILELAGKYYHHLLGTPAGASAKKYLLGRGLDEETISAWQIGYSPESWDELYNFLRSRPKSGPKYSDEEIAAAGLVSRKEGGRSYFDRFRGRIMFPIRDLSGHLVAFTARVSPEREAIEKGGKYINSPQTQVYDKSRIVFGLDKAKSAIREKDCAIVVEGQMDAISAHQHGFANVVAASGTALTADQISLIKRFSRRLVLAFDMDDAGQMAADRGIREALKQEMSLRILTLPQGKDPDECLRHDPEDFQAALDSAKPMLEYYLDKISRGLDMAELEAKQAVSEKMLEMLGFVSDRLEQDFWLKRLAELVQAPENILRERLSQKKIPGSGAVPKAGSVEAGGRPANREVRLAEALFALLLRFPEFLPYAISKLEPEYVPGESQNRFYNQLIIYYNKSASLAYEPFRFHLEAQGGGDEILLDKLSLLGEKDYYDLEPAQAKSEAIKLIVELRRFGCQRRIAKLESGLAQAEKAGDKGAVEKLMAELKSLTDELRSANLDKQD